MNHTVTLIPSDGIGPEVFLGGTATTTEFADAICREIEFEEQATA